MTLDEVAVEMRQRFTEAGGKRVTITAEEWHAMAEGIKIRDALETVLDFPDRAEIVRAAAAALAPHRRK